MTWMAVGALRARCAELVTEIAGAGSGEEAVDAIVAAFTHLHSAGLLEVDPDALEVANMRRLLERHGVAPADHQGVARPTVAMLEEALVARPPGR